MPDLDAVLGGDNIDRAPVKRGRGRPKGSKTRKRARIVRHLPPARRGNPDLDDSRIAAVLACLAHIERRAATWRAADRLAAALDFAASIAPEGERRTRAPKPHHDVATVLADRLGRPAYVWRDRVSDEVIALMMRKPLIADAQRWAVLPRHVTYTMAPAV